MFHYLISTSVHTISSSSSLTLLYILCFFFEQPRYKQTTWGLTDTAPYPLIHLSPMFPHGFIPLAHSLHGECQLVTHEGITMQNTSHYTLPMRPLGYSPPLMVLTLTSLGGSFHYDTYSSPSTHIPPVPEKPWCSPLWCRLCSLSEGDT
ncbi:hypothetical protein ADUPG1_003002 [Aduncisulcus paluster]|uniref:Uncharacterized protein n=1 Tax=Aduncisulcus paluster TaxID=2918883 RepID=A0ABQ5KSV8_9EUKA|nr:hypothetical protein ADUPG1_003002 [Aduncisulcus paluster]